MNSEAKNSVLTLRLLTDLVAITLAWVASYFIRFTPGLPTPKGIPEFYLYLKLVPFLWVLSVMAFTVTGHYKRTGKHRTPLLESIDIIPSSLVLVVSFVTFSYFYEEYRYSRGVTLAFTALCPFFLIAGRSLLRKRLRAWRKSMPPIQVLVIADEPLVAHALSIVDKTELRNSQIAKIVTPGKLFACKGFQVESLPESWVDLISQNRIESVIIAVSNIHYEQLTTVLNEIVDQVAHIRIVPDVLRFVTFSPGIDLINGLPVVSIHESPLVGRGIMLKRVLDIFGALFALLLFSPIMITISLLIPFSSRGPILYRQERMGLDGKRFFILKFRSMPMNAEQASGAVWAHALDSRATKLGALLRKTSLDELPQLFNVLSGDMSLVGPRPERPIFVDQFRRKIPGYMLRHKVKAGITGWAQVNGWRGDTSLEKRIEFDLYYVQNWSLLLDIKILLMTVVSGFVNRNAY